MLKHNLPNSNCVIRVRLGGMDTAETALRRGPPPLAIGPVAVDPPLVQAPMAGFTNYAYRQIVRRFGGAGLLTTDSLPQRLWGVRDEPRPLAVQIWDNDPGALAAVGERLAHEFRVSVIDVNFGCPVRRVTERTRSGSYLLRSPERVGAIVARVARACQPVPVTAKIRLGLSRKRINAVEVARAVEEAGGAAVTVHGRTAQDMFRGRADWQAIAEIKPHLRRIPLVGNGDLKTPEDVVEAFARFAVDGVMIGRAALGRPWLFRQAQAALVGQAVPPDPSPDQQRQVLLDHHRMLADRLGERRATILMRKYACQYAQGRRGARTFRARVGRVTTPEEFAAVVGEWFPQDEAVG
jgi:tRNA-dihydrouridine synthase B